MVFNRKNDMKSYFKKMMEQDPSKKITYSTFIEAALYHPQLGYYMKPKQKIGKDGDFFTSSNVHTIYGKLFAKLFISIFASEKLPPVICEIGAGTGRFANQVLAEIKKESPSVYSQLSYIVVETSPYHLNLQQQLLPKDANITYYEKVENVPPFQGIIFSNELFDALPVSVIKKQNGTIYEIFITMNNEEQFVEVIEPLQNNKIKKYIEETGLELQEGQRIEIPLAMEPTIRSLSQILQKGIVFTVDYGYTFEEWKRPEHRDGSLRGYYQHQLVSDPLQYVGEMDLTTHIHLNSLEHFGQKYGLSHVFTMKQGEFLVSAGILQYLEYNYDPNPFSEISKQNRAIRSLIMDSSLSNSFTVIAQQKNINAKWSSLIDI